MIKYYFQTLSLILLLMSFTINYMLRYSLQLLVKIFLLVKMLDVLHVPTLIGKFWKTLNPRNFQTNNPKKLPLVQMKELLKSFLMMYHKCQKSSISKSLKTEKKKKRTKWTEYKVPPQILWVGTTRITQRRNWVLHQLRLKK